MLSCHFAWNKVWRLGSRKNLWRRWILNPFFPSMCFSLKRFLHKFMTAPCLCFPLRNPLWFWRPSQSSLRTQCVLRDRWEEMIHSSDDARDTRPSWPADLMVYIAGLPQRGCRATLIRAFSGTRCAGHHLSRSDSVWQQTQAGFTCTSHKLSQTSDQIRNCRDDSVMWGSDRPVRAVIIFYQEEIWIWPQVCVFLCLWAFCG